MIIYVDYLASGSKLDSSVTRQIRFITTDKGIAVSIGFYMNKIKSQYYECYQTPHGKKLDLDDVQSILNCNYDNALHIYNRLQQKVVVNEFELAQYNYDLTTYLISLLDDVKGEVGYK